MVDSCFEEGAFLCALMMQRFVTLHFGNSFLHGVEDIVSPSL